MLAFLISSAAVLVADQAVKAAALRRRPAGEGPGFVYRENPSGALGAVSTPVSGAVLASAVALFVAVLVLSDWPALMALGLGAATGGAASNFLDQATRGFVIDYLELPTGATVNLGDVAITVGVAVGVVALL